MTAISVKKFGPLVHVALDELGRILCPHCQGVMVEVGPGELSCPDWAPVLQEMRTRFDAAFIERLSANVTENLLGGRPSMTGIAQFGAQDLLWPLESGLSWQRAGERRTADLREFASPVNWDAALRTLERATA